jgi:hypothetical protein
MKYLFRRLFRKYELKIELNEPYTNLTWDDEGMWKGWTYSLENNCYYFDDIGNESLTGLWTNRFLSQAE